LSDILEETEGHQSDDDDKTDESMPPDENDPDDFSLFIKFRQISSKISIFFTTASFRTHFVSFSSKTTSFGAYLASVLPH